jgi:Mn-dependent DtxR family transcriptional regulator
MTEANFNILRAIYQRSHALRQNNASLDEVAADVGVHPTRLYDACRQLKEQGLLIMPARFLQLTQTGRKLAEG